MLKRVSFILIALFLCLKGYSQTSFPLALNPASALRMAVVDNGDGSFTLTTNGADPYISINELTSSYDYQSTYYISFDYISTGGLDDLTVFYGVPSADKKLSVGALAPSATYKNFTINLKRSPNWATYYTKFRFDFGTTAGQSIQIKNITLRPPTTAEYNSDPFTLDERNNTFIKHYLNTNFTNTVNSVKVDQSNVVIETNNPTNANNLFLCELRMFDPLFKPENIVFSQALTTDRVVKTTLPRNVVISADTYDRIYSRWVIAEKNGATYTYKSFAHFADDVGEAAVNYLPEVKPENKKGLGGFGGAQAIADLVPLGLKSITSNVIYSSVLSLTPSSLPFVFNGKTYYMNATTVANLDATYKACAESNTIVSVIILIPINGSQAQQDIFRHPDSESTASYSMANVTSLNGLNYYAAVTAFLAERYSRPDNLYGRVTNWIIHNEVDAGSVWTNAGQKAMETYTELYDRSMRTVYYTIRKYNPAGKVFASITHHWSLQVDYAPNKLLGFLVDLSKKQGDYEWGLAYHPYPENLFDFEIWKDTQINFNLNTSPLITPKNIELIDTWIRQKSSLYKGLKVRSLIFSEEGVHAGANYDATTFNKQASGVAYMWKKFSRLPSLEGIQYHRRVDNTGEGGLYMGLWTTDKTSTSPEVQDTKKLSWTVWQNAGTANEDNAFAFALPFVGVSTWDQTFNPLLGEVNLCKVDFTMSSQGAPKNDIYVYFNGERHKTETAGAATFYNVASLSNTRSYQVKNGEKVIWPSVETTTSTDQTINVNLDPVANFTALRQSPTSVKLEWQDITNFETRYVLEYKADGQSNFTKVADIAANSTSYLNAGLTNNLNYQYRLYAINDTVQTLYSKVVDADGILSSQYLPDNLVVLRVGDGTTYNTGTTRAVSLLELTKAGATVSTTNLDVNTPSARISLVDNAATEGLLKLSVDKNYLSLAGYDATAATDGTTAFAGSKVVVRVGENRIPDYTTKVKAGDFASNFRCALSQDGSTFYITSASGGVKSVPYANSSSTAATNIAFLSGMGTANYTNAYSLAISGGQLYTGFFNTTNYGLSSIGTGNPTSSSTPTSLLGITKNVKTQDFIFFDMNPNIIGDDVLYVTENTDLKKYSLVSGTWTLNSTTALGNVAFGITGYINASKKVQLFFTTGTVAENNKLQTLTDANTYNLVLDGNISDVASAGTGYAFRGVAFTPKSNISTTLPVTLQNFNGKKVQDGVQLNWTTLSENNNERFDVLRSEDATNFQAITSVKGNGTSTKTNSYAYLDSKPLSGINYYQLNQIDFDGKAALSKTVAINFDVEKDGIVIYSDATNLNFNVKSLKNGEAKVVVYTVNGVEILAKSYYLQSGLSSKSIDISDLKEGVYIVKISLNDMVSTQKFVR